MLLLFMFHLIMSYKLEYWTISIILVYAYKLSEFSSVFMPLTYSRHCLVVKHLDFIYFSWYYVGDSYILKVSASLEKALKVTLTELDWVWSLYCMLLCIHCYSCNIKNENLASFFQLVQLKGSIGSMRQYVHGSSLVRARRFYGYHSSEELFVKIYLYPDFFLSFIFR